MVTETERGPQTPPSEEEILEHYANEAELFFKTPYVFKKPIKKVAVIGAGPAGLVSTKTLKEAGLDVKVFERASSVGGIWVYTETPPSKPKVPTRREKHPIEHSAEVAPEEGIKKRMCEITPEAMKRLLHKSPPTACYRDMYNNIPLPIFAFPCFPFPEDEDPYRPHHIILDYLKRFSEHYELDPLISLNTSVELARKNKENGSWKLSLNKHTVYPSGLIKEERWQEEFDAILVASGRHQEPYVPDFKDLLAYNKTWPDKVTHSKQFRRPEDFSKKNVLLVGGGISGVDIARSLDGFANTVTVSMRQFASPFPVINIIREAIPRSVSIRGDIKSFSDENGEMNGNITFTDGTVLSGIDHVIFCTGFASNIPFFGELQVPEGGENTLKKFENIQESQILADYKNPLNVYREIFLASDPTVAFVGMKADFTLHPHFAIQSEAIARVWTGNAYLPETSSMYTSILEGTPLCMTTDTNLYEKLRNIPYIAWVNTHAKLIKDNGGQELPEMENYRDSFVEELNKYQKIWLEISEKNIQQTKEKIRKEKIKTKVYAY